MKFWFRMDIKEYRTQIGRKVLNQKVHLFLYLRIQPNYKLNILTMKKLFLTFTFLAFFAGVSIAQSYDSVSGATQKEDGKSMNLEQFKKALGMEKKLVFSTVNEDGTPNAAVYGSFNHIEGNIFAVNSMADAKTTKINVKRTKEAILLLVLNGKTEDDFDGAKVVLKYIESADKIAKLRAKLEKSSERTTFFSVEKFLIYH